MSEGLGASSGITYYCGLVGGAGFGIFLHVSNALRLIRVSGRREATEALSVVHMESVKDASESSRLFDV